MRILLIEPSTGEKGITSFSYPPMGLIALASYIRKFKNEVAIYDANIEHADIDKVKEIIGNFAPDLVGISSMTLTITSSFKIAEIIKKINKKILVVLGGIHPSVCPRESLDNENVDFVVMGEGEITMRELIKSLKDGVEDFSKIKGLAYKENNKIFINSSRGLIPSLDELPIPAYDLININQYRSPYTSRFPFISMVRSRGCIFRCVFCGNAKMFGPTFRCQSPERTIREIDFLIKNYGIRELSFKDTELTLDKNLSKLCRLMIEKDYDLIWSCNGRTSNVNQSLLDLMEQAGCRTVTYGIESGDERILKNLKKPINLDNAREAVKLTKRIGLKVVTNFMIGNPGDTKETIEKTIKFSIVLDPDYAYFGFTTPFPGTELRELAIKNGWLLDARMEAVRYDYPIMNATNLDTEELKKYLDKAYRKFYFRPKYILKQLMDMKLSKLKSSLIGVIAIIINMIKVKKYK